MQELIEWFNENHLLLHLPIDLLEKSQELLEKEKEQIMKAYKDCHNYMHVYGLDSEKYFNEEYKNK